MNLNKSLLLLPLVLLSTSTRAASVPKPALLERAFVIVLENKNYESIVGNSDLPQINALIKKGGLASNYWGLVHPSMGNYVAMISGDLYGIHDDDSSRSLVGPTLADQLEGASKGWKAYMESIPQAGSNVLYTVPDVLYAKKHNPFLLFKSIQTTARARNVVPLEQLYSDLKSPKAPALLYIVPNQCNDMHGAPGCIGRGSLMKSGDAYVGKLVADIMASKAWTPNSALFLTFDEGDLENRRTPPSALEVGGHILTLVISGGNLKPRSSDLPFNHYSLLRTLEEGFGLKLLGAAKNARALWPLF